MKSSAHKALASLTYKYQQKICQLGRAYRREDELIEQVKNLESDLRMAKQTAVAAASSNYAEHVQRAFAAPYGTTEMSTIERLEFDLRCANHQLTLLRGLPTTSQELATAKKLLVKAQNAVEAAQAEAGKWESWACAYATLAVIASCAGGAIAWKYAVLTGIL